MNFAELKAQTAVKVVGIVNQLCLYVNKDKKEYHSVDLLVNGHKSLLNIKLPEDFPRAKLVEGAIYTFNVIVSEYQGRTNLTAVV